MKGLIIIDRVLIVMQDYEQPKFITKNEYYPDSKLFAKRLSGPHIADYEYRKFYLDQLDPMMPGDWHTLKEIYQLCNYPKYEDEKRLELFNKFWNMGREANTDVQIY